jgi:hypothetical protein
MDKPIYKPHGPDMDALNNATRGTGVSAGRRVKAAGDSAAKDKTPSWESAFHAERGCLSCGPSPRQRAPQPQR